MTMPQGTQVQPDLFFDGRCEEAGAGGQVQMPLTKTFFSPRFGMVADRFGVSWMIYVAP